jgi:hypothetical protein
MPANDTQVGGDHYKSSYEHWDLVIKLKWGYLEGCTTKHVARWRKKNGMQDLQKAGHYLDKLIEVATYDTIHDGTAVDREIERFVWANELGVLEYQYLFILGTYHNDKMLKSARQILNKIIDVAKEDVVLK